MTGANKTKSRSRFDYDSDDCQRYVDAVEVYHYCAGDNTCVIDLEVYDYDLYDPRTY
jgi:hypothetical protein